MMFRKWFIPLLVCLVLLPAIMFAGGQKEAEGTKEAAAPTAGVSLPADALPAAQQVLNLPLSGENGAYLDFMKTMYDCITGAAWLAQEALLAFDKDLEAIPMGYTSVDVSEDGMTWTFHLRKELKWSDGQPITAQDYVFGLQRNLNQGYDSSWYWNEVCGFKNYDKIEKGELPVAQLGVKALDDYTLSITTEVPKPYLLGALVWLFPVPRHAIDKYGDEYATKPDTMVCSGPFMVSEWVRGDHITFKRNPYYQGLWKPYVEEIVLKYGTFEPETGFPAYQNDEIYRSYLNPGQMAFAAKNMPNEMHSWPGYRIYFLSFGTSKPPFDDIRVRQAFNHAIDREEMCSTVLKDLGTAEYSPLMSGYPGYDPKQAKSLSKYDPDLAKKLLADAGYPNGAGFPKLEMWATSHNLVMAWQKPAADYLQARFKEILGVDIVPRFIDQKVFVDARNKRTQNFLLNAYQFDYMDPSNFMDLFMTGGRLDWSNSDYDALVRRADVGKGWENRVGLYRKAEKILIENAPAAFIFQQLTAAVWKPYLKGEGVEANKNGVKSWHEMWGKYIMTHVYVAEH